ncbi:hypothetical protein F4777DRAFT_560754 [Nemania sp. FL0916]|nr:hypothetical protein F4777DRAFT_560754 [Nemania sp. FL0916]
MALFRSASGPGALSINTSSATMFGLNASSAPAAKSLFGASTTPAAASTPKPSLFGSTTASAPTSQPAASLFGGAATTTAAPSQPTPSLFASTASAQPQQQQTGGGLFGAPQAQAQTQPQSQPQQTGGLFGSANTTSQTNTTATGSGGLFGLSNQAQSGANGTTSVLGQPAQPRPNLFGSLGQPAQTQQSNTFGQPQQQQQQQQQPAVGLGGGLGFGLTMGQPNNQPTVPGVRIDITNLKGTTRFNDLQEDLQKVIERIDSYIVEQARRKDEVDSFMSGHREMLESIPTDVTFITRKSDGARNALESAAQSIEVARTLVNQDADHARLSFRAIDNLKLPQQYHTSGFWSPRQQASGNANSESDGQDLVGFFSKTADEMADQMNKYGRNLTEIELHMHGVSDNLVEQLQRMMAAKSGASSADEKIQELVAVLRDFEQGILKVAGDVGSARESMTRLQLGDFMSHDRGTNGIY